VKIIICDETIEESSFEKIYQQLNLQLLPQPQFCKIIDSVIKDISQKNFLIFSRYCIFPYLVHTTVADKKDFVTSITNALEIQLNGVIEEILVPLFVEHKLVDVLFKILKSMKPDTTVLFLDKSLNHSFVCDESTIQILDSIINKPQIKLNVDLLSKFVQYFLANVDFQSPKVTKLISDLVVRFPAESKNQKSNLLLLVSKNDNFLVKPTIQKINNL